MWGRTYNVDHEEYKELRIEFTDEGTFIEKDLSSYDVRIATIKQYVNKIVTIV